MDNRFKYTKSNKANHNFTCEKCGYNRFKTVKKYRFINTSQPEKTHKAKFACRKCGHKTLDFQFV